MNRRSTGAARVSLHAVASALLMGLLSGGTLAAQDSPIPVTGSVLSLRLTDGDKVQGELIEATGGRLVILDDGGLHDVDLAAVRQARAQRHTFGAGDVFTWVAVGALVTGIGMTVACNQVEDTDCAAVLPAVGLTWVLLGLPFAAGVSSSGWEEVPAVDEQLRRYARFPQGAPGGFRPPGGGGGR